MNLPGAKRVFMYRTCEESTDPASEASESEVIRRLQGGDISALGELFTRYKELAYRTALAISRDERAAEDILQECFVRLYTYADSVDPERPLKPWLYRVTVNLAYDWLSRKPKTQPIDGILEWLASLPGSFASPDGTVDDAETLSTVRDVIGTLPAGHRAVVVLFYLEDLNLHEISQVLELPVGTVKSRLHYARERLRETLAQRERTVPEMAYEFT